MSGLESREPIFTFMYSPNQRGLTKRNWKLCKLVQGNFNCRNHDKLESVQLTVLLLILHVINVEDPLVTNMPQLNPNSFTSLSFWFQFLLRIHKESHTALTDQKTTAFTDKKQGLKPIFYTGLFPLDLDLFDTFLVNLLLPTLFNKEGLQYQLYLLLCKIYEQWLSSHDVKCEQTDWLTDACENITFPSKQLVISYKPSCVVAILHHLIFHQLIFLLQILYPLC